MTTPRISIFFILIKSVRMRCDISVHVSAAVISGGEPECIVCAVLRVTVDISSANSTNRNGFIKY